LLYPWRRADATRAPPAPPGGVRSSDMGHASAEHDDDDPGDEPADSVRARYERHGAEAYYRDHAADYVNPHEPEVAHALRLAASTWALDLSHVLDLACGGGEATRALRELGAARVDGCDPYLSDLYERRTGTPAERFGFDDVARGALAGRAYSLVVCSFALHLAEPSRLPVLCYQLSVISPALLVLTPHKRPTVRPDWGWRLAGEFVWARVRARWYRSAF
jgi:SAM-dependent methyltransferase